MKDIYETFVSLFGEPSGDISLVANPKNHKIEISAVSVSGYCGEPQPLSRFAAYMFIRGSIEFLLAGKTLILERNSPITWVLFVYINYANIDFVPFRLDDQIVAITKKG